MPGPAHESTPATAPGGPGPAIDAAATAVADAVAAAVADALSSVVASTATASPRPPATAGQGLAASEPPPAADQDAAQPPVRVVLAYARYLALFVGAGLIAGAVVHLPMAPLRYAVLAAVGAVLFTAGSLGADVLARAPRERALHVAASLGVAVGVGMVAGGVQHAADVPGRAAVLVPAGLLLGLAAFAVRDGHRLARQHLIPVGAAAVVLAAVIGGTLHLLAVPASAVGGHAASHAKPEPAAGEDHEAADDAPAAGGHGAAGHAPAGEDHGRAHDAPAADHDGSGGTVSRYASPSGEH